jgi:hypothetical protein
MNLKTVKQVFGRVVKAPYKPLHEAWRKDPESLPDAPDKPHVRYFIAVTIILALYSAMV